MDVEHYRTLLVAKEEELTEDLARAKSEAIDASSDEVGDETDAAVRTSEQESALDQGTQDTDTLEQVRDALKRIGQGTYGLCQVCGRPIEEKRLEAVPWAAYDVPHQAERDRVENRPTGGATL
jgi:DnaK suppressor protein